MVIMLLSTNSLFAKVICNEFNVLTEVTGRQLSFCLTTDLPDDTIVMTSVSRFYLQKGNGETHLRNYFSKKTTVHELKQKVGIVIDDTKWKNGLEKQQKMFASFGKPFEVVEISDEVELDLTIPINQDNPAFGNGNKNLESPFVSKKGLRTIRVEKKFNIPFNKEKKKLLSAKKQYSLDPNNLEVGLLYRISKKTPIPKERKPKDQLKAIVGMRYLPAGSVFRILKKVPSNVSMYYHVRADVGGNAQHKVTGWIRSPALMGQDLSVVE